jgi:Protein kinase domain
MITGGAATELGGYVLEEEIGSGASSVVYRARHARLGRRAAVKVLALPRGGPWRERFLSESRIAASIDHPNVIPVYDAGEDAGGLYIAMRLVDGIDLRALLEREGRLSIARTVRIVRQVADALDAAHARGLVHRDVKPANILLEASDHVYLSDFGVAKGVETLGLTRTGAFVGSVEYSAPEQIEGRAIDGRSDLYALACVAYECLAGSPPFHRETEVGVLHAHLHDRAPDVRTARPETPAALSAALERGLARDPADRHASGHELARALEQAARSGSRRVHVARGRVALLAALLAAAAALGVLAGYLLAPPRAGETLTVVRTVRVADSHALGDAAYAQLQAKNYPAALSYARRAFAALPATKPGDPYRGYVNYDLGLALTRLGRCSQALPYLRRASRLEPHEPKVLAALRLAERC